MKKVLVIGDVILDEFHRGHAIGISAETPTVVAKLQESDRYLGGAGLVVRHLLRLGCRVDLMTVGTTDADLFVYLIGSSDAPTTDELKRLNIHVVKEDGWRFTRKMRCFVDGYKMVQYDVLNEGKPTWELRQKLSEKFCELRKDADAVVICDNRHGVMEMGFIDVVMKKTKQYGPPVFVDSQVSQKESNLSFYGGYGATMFVNSRELDCVVAPWTGTWQERLANASDRLKSAIVLKRGSDGASLSDYPKARVDVPAPKVDAVDTCGAGDAFMAAYVSSGGDMGFATRWASLSTTYIGTVVPSKEEKNGNAVPG